MKLSINGLHILAVALPAAVFFSDIQAPWLAYALVAMPSLGGAILLSRFLEKIEMAKKAEEESKVAETKELRRLVESYDRFCRKLGTAAKEKGLAVVFDDEVYDNPEYTGSIFVIGSGSKVTQSVAGQQITLAPRSCNGEYILAIDPTMFRGRHRFGCYPATDIAPGRSVEIKP